MRPRKKENYGPFMDLLCSQTFISIIKNNPRNDSGKLYPFQSVKCLPVVIQLFSADTGSDEELQAGCFSRFNCL